MKQKNILKVKETKKPCTLGTGCCCPGTLLAFCFDNPRHSSYYPVSFQGFYINLKLVLLPWNSLKFPDSPYEGGVSLFPSWKAGRKRRLNLLQIKGAHSQSHPGRHWFTLVFCYVLSLFKTWSFPLQKLLKEWILL